MKDLEKVKTDIMDYLKAHKGIARVDKLLDEVMKKELKSLEKKELLRHTILFLRSQEEIKVLLSVMGEFIESRTTDEIKKMKLRYRDAGMIGIDEVSLDEFFSRGPFYCFYVLLKD